MSNEYKDWIADMDPIKRQNLSLIVKYPILIIHDEWKSDIYDYDHTWLDDIPDGWRNAFGLQWVEEIQKAVDNYYIKLKAEKPDADEFDDLYIIQLKEKYGQFTQYFSHYTPELREIIKKYSELSEKICINCGKPAKYRTTGWVSPWCEDCIQQINDKFIEISN